MLTLAEATNVVIDTVSGIVEDDDDITNDPNQNLLDMGLNSLLMARLLIRLERTFGINPFGEGGASISTVRTVEQLATHYIDAQRAGRPVRIGA